VVKDKKVLILFPYLGILALSLYNKGYKSKGFKDGNFLAPPFSASFS